MKKPAKFAFPALLLLLAATAGTLGLPPVRASTITKYSLVGLHPTYPASGIPTGLVARDGYVYFSYQNSLAGIGRLDPATTSIKLYPLPSQAGYTVVAFDLGEAYAWVLTEDGTGGKSLYSLNLANGRTANWLVGSHTNGLLVENDSSIWLTGSSLDHFNPNTGEMKTYPLPCPAARCWTNSTNVFRPIWVNGKVWALLDHGIPAPNYAGEELIEIDPRTGNMAVYPMPKFYQNGQFSNEAASDMTSDSHGNLWLMLGGVMAKFDTTTGNYEFVQSTFGGNEPAACDKEGNLFFVQRNYTQSLIEYSPSSQSFTDYWTAPIPPGGTPASIQDLVVDSNDMVWFLNTYVLFSPNETYFMDLYRLSVGGAGTTITTTASFNTTQTSGSTIPSGGLTYTSTLASSTETPVSTVVMTQSTSTLGEASTMTATQTLAVDEFSVYVTLFLLVTLLVSALVLTQSFRHRTRTQRLRWCSAGIARGNKKTVKIFIFPQKKF